MFFVFCVFVCLFVFSRLFCGVMLLFSLGWKRWTQFYHYNISERGEISTFTGLRKMRLISLQWDLKSETCRDFKLRIPLWCSFMVACCVVFNQGCWIFIQYNLLEDCCEPILIQPQTQVIDCSLPGLTWRIKLRISIFHLSISGLMVRGRYHISHCFYFSVIFCDCLLVDLCFLF